MSATENDHELVKQLYVEAQHWARHYESLLVQGNVLIIPISLGFLGFAFATEKATHPERLAAIIVSALLAGMGFLLVRMLFGLYSTTIERMVRLETLLGCFDVERGNGLDGRGPLLPLDLARIPVTIPPSVRFFNNVYIALAIILPMAFFFQMLFPRAA